MFEFTIDSFDIKLQQLKQGNYKFLVENNSGITVNIVREKLPAVTIDENETYLMDFDFYSSEQVLGLVYRGLLTLKNIQK